MQIERERERERERESKTAHKVEINEVKDFNNDGKIDQEDIKYLLEHDRNASCLLNEHGDFRSNEAIELLKQADIVVTNPPFSLFREYVAQLIEYDKKFLIIGNVNATSYKEIFPLIGQNKLWLGHTCNRWFFQPNGELFETARTYWFTNLDHKKRHEELILYKQYTPEEYPKYDNYDAINVDKAKEIPCNYDGVMGVPITFLDKYNPEQFEIVAFREDDEGNKYIYSYRTNLIEPLNSGDKLTPIERERERDLTTMSSDQWFKARRFTEEYLSGDGNKRTYEQSKRYSSQWQEQICKNTYSQTAIAGMIKNAEGKINGKITYARITIRKIKKGKT